MIRLDKYISDTLPCTRKEAIKLIKGKKVSVNGEIITQSDKKIDENASVFCLGNELLYSKYIYIMLNKPQGLISATEDEREKTVMSLLPESYMTKGLFPAGRLDKDTTGLLILTNDGETAHRLLSPKYNKKKIYKVTAESPFSKEDTEKLKNGIMLDDGMTKPVTLQITDIPNIAYMTLTEGRFHEVKRICIALDNKCIDLERVEFASLVLDKKLERGAWRLLTQEEIDILLENSQKKS